MGMAQNETEGVTQVLVHVSTCQGQNQWYHFGVGEFTTHFRTYFIGEIGMFTGGTIWVLTQWPYAQKDVPEMASW